MRRWAPLLAAAFVGYLFVACTVSSPEVTSGVAASGGPTGAAQTIEPSPSAVPGASSPGPGVAPSVAPSVTPRRALADLLPDYAGATMLDRQPATVEALVADGDRLGVGRLLSDLGLDPIQLEVAAASTSGVGFLALRAEGISGPDLAETYVAAVMEALPGTSRTGVEVGGVDAQRVVARAEDLDVSLTVLPIGDAIVIAAAESDQEALAELTLSRMLRPGPERFLPAELDGRRLEITAMPGEAFPIGGDVCAIMCPGEVQGMAALLGVEPTDVRLALGFLQDPPAIAVLAFEFPGVAADDLIAIGERRRPDNQGWRRTENTIGGKTVVRFRDGVGDMPGLEEWLYAKDGVMYVLSVEPDGDDVPPIIEEALAALP